MFAFSVIGVALSEAFIVAGLVTGHLSWFGGGLYCLICTYAGATLYSYEEKK